MKYLAILLLLIVLSGCASDEKDADKVTYPSIVMPPDSLAFHLANIHILEAAMRHRDVRKQALQLNAKNGFEDYFDTSKVSRERFERSLSYWEKNFDEMANIYDLAMERLSTKLARMKQSSEVAADSTTRITPQEKSVEAPEKPKRLKQEQLSAEQRRLKQIQERKQQRSAARKKEKRAAKSSEAARQDTAR